MNRNTYRGKQTGCRCAKVGKTAYYQTKWVEQIDGKEVVEGDVGGDFCPECGRPISLRPMTLEEAVAYGRPVFVESRWVNGKRIFEWNVTNVLEALESDPADIAQAFRFWTDEPTPEQSAAWKWEEEATMIVKMVAQWDKICDKYRRREGLMLEQCNDCPLHVSEEFGCQMAMHEETEKFAKAWVEATSREDGVRHD